MTAATSSVELGRGSPVVASPAKKKFHELNPHMLSSKALNQGNDLLTRFFQVLYMGLYALANVVFVCIPFAIDYAVSGQPAVVKKAERKLEISNEKLANLINLETRSGTYSNSTPSESIINARDACDTASQNLIKARAFLEEGKLAPAPARARAPMSDKPSYMPVGLSTEGVDF